MLYCLGICKYACGGRSLHDAVSRYMSPEFSAKFQRKVCFILKKRNKKSVQRLGHYNAVLYSAGTIGLLGLLLAVD